ncbi:chordin [Platysternon megacephalum]|uniref:Chordin n=1 Tax=Platysternon megacephalum TaxID=55544 RepID=A0A4D9DS35_9SAUR|nr:chordin [Platysternon megacephalum]
MSLLGTGSFSRAQGANGPQGLSAPGLGKCLCARNMSAHLPAAMETGLGGVTLLRGPALPALVRSQLLEYGDQLFQVRGALKARGRGGLGAGGREGPIAWLLHWCQRDGRHPPAPGIVIYTWAEWVTIAPRPGFSSSPHGGSHLHAVCTGVNGRARGQEGGAGSRGFLLQLHSSPFRCSQVPSPLSPSLSYAPQRCRPSPSQRQREGHPQLQPWCVPTLAFRPGC